MQDRQRSSRRLPQARIRRACALAPLLAGFLACAAPVEAPAPGRSTAWGYVTLVPRHGAPRPGAGGGYGDRRMRDVRLVDYSHPGFVVVFVEGVAPASDGGETSLTIRGGAVAPRLEPRHAALAARGTLAIRNEDDRAHVVSCPAASAVFALAPGETRRIAIGDSGEYPLFLIDVPGASSLVFAAPGAYDVVSASGRFELDDLPPGRRRLGTWHPRLPASFRRLELEPGAIQRVDVEIGVDVEREEAADAR